jgi:N-acetylglucosamine-6-sulfatase
MFSQMRSRLGGCRDRFSFFCLAAVLMVSSVASAQEPTDPVDPPAPPKPNLILIMTDDQTVEDLKAMPLTSKFIGGQGATFSNSFVSWPLCCPSRATTFTGLYAHNHGVLGNYPPDGGSNAFTTDAETLPVWLQRAGYNTIHIGKYLNGYGHDIRGSTYIPPGWTDWMGLVDPTTYQMWGYTVNHNGELRTYGEYNVQDPALYQTDVLRKLAVDAINRNAQSGQPFFLSVAFLAPHEERSETPAPGTTFPGPRPAPRHVGAFAGTSLPRPVNFDEADLSDKPAVVGAFAAASGGETMAQRTSRYQRRLEALKAVDEAVWGILARLAALGILDDTYVVFTSDNGWFNGEHRISRGKYLMYDPALRVPLMMRGPGIAPGSTDELVANIDLAPTFVELAGATAGRVVDGRSLVPFARDPTLRTARPILLDAPHNQLIPATGTIVDVPPMRGLRTKKWSYVEYGTGEVEMYDMVQDPGQMKSVGNLGTYRGLRDSFHAALMQYTGCEGDACRAELRPVSN